MERLLWENWRLKDVEYIKPIKENVYRVGCRDGDFVLKRSKLKRSSLDLVTAAEADLFGAGFTACAPPLATVTGDGADGAGNTLHRYVPGDPCDFQNERHLTAAAATLAKLHLYGRARPDLRHRRRGHCSADIYAQRLSELRTDAVPAAATPLAAFYREHAPDAIARGEHALKILAGDDYRELIDEANAVGSLIHGDVAARNILIRQEQAFLIDFDYCRVDTPMADLARLLRRAAVGPDLRRRIDAILRGYGSVRPLSPPERRVLPAMLRFPQKFWRCSQRYLRDRDRRAAENLRRAPTETAVCNRAADLCEMILE